jgi:hypothetical protein
MDANKSTQSFHALSLGSILFAVAGAVFYWWLPLGTVFSLTGLVLGFIDWTSARRRSRDQRLGIVGMVLAAAALALNLVIAYLGLQTVTFGQ